MVVNLSCLLYEVWMDLQAFCLSHNDCNTNFHILLMCVSTWCWTCDCLCRTAVKDRIVAFLLFLGKIVIVCVIGEYKTRAVTNTYSGVSDGSQWHSDTASCTLIVDTITPLSLNLDMHMYMYNIKSSYMLGLHVNAQHFAWLPVVSDSICFALLCFALYV